MTEFSTLLCTGLLPRLGLEPCVQGGIQQWIKTGTYIPRNNGQSGAVVLGRVASVNFVPAIGYDFERFALAAKESSAVALHEKESVGSLGW